MLMQQGANVKCDVINAISSTSDNEENQWVLKSEVSVKPCTTVNPVFKVCGDWIFLDFVYFTAYL